jgi:hypothetical protein
MCVSRHALIRCRSSKKPSHGSHFKKSSGGWARSYSIIDAKLGALRRCEHHNPVPVCTILWCRPGF